jgi:hypothetical protein
MSEIFEQHFKNIPLDNPDEEQSKLIEQNKIQKKGLEITISSKSKKKSEPEPSPPNETLFKSFHSQLASIPFEQFLKLIESNELFSDILFHIFILNNKKLNSATDRFSFSSDMIRNLLEQKKLNLGTFLAESSISEYINDNVDLGMDFLDSFLWSLDNIVPDYNLDSLCDQVVLLIFF